MIRTAALVDLDGIPPLDLVGGSFDAIAAWEFRPVMTTAQSAPLTLNAINAEIWQLSILPTDNGPYLVTFEQAPAQIVHRPLGYSSGSFANLPGLIETLQLTEPIVAVVADLDNNGTPEYRVVATNGQSSCFVYAAVGGLASCSAN